MSLIVIGEGREETKDYLMKNGVYPNKVIYDISRFDEVSPYLMPNDIVLVIIHGFTDYSKAKILKMISNVHENVNIGERNLLIFSDIIMEELPIKYYLYDSNIFTDDLVTMTGKKRIKNQDILKWGKRQSREKAVVEGLKKYNSESVKCVVLEDTVASEVSDVKPKATDSTDVTQYIKIIDVLKE